MLDILAILLSLGLLMYLAFRGVSLLLLAPGCALLAALLTGGLPILAAYTQVFMSNAGQFIIAFFPLFMLGAIFGKLMDDTGSARSVARTVSDWLGPKRAIASVVLCCAVLTYGGVSAFVVAFAIFPVAAALFRGADIPKRLISERLRSARSRSPCRRCPARPRSRTRSRCHFSAPPRLPRPASAFSRR